MYSLVRIKKECFWEFTFTDEEILKLSKNDRREQKYLFEKILLNSTEMLQDLEIFNKDDLELLISDFKVPSFNYNYIFKRKNIAEVYFLDKELLVNELRWAS